MGYGDTIKRIHESYPGMGRRSSGMPYSGTPPPTTQTGHPMLGSGPNYPGSQPRIDARVRGGSPIAQGFNGGSIATPGGGMPPIGQPVSPFRPAMPPQSIGQIGAGAGTGASQQNGFLSPNYDAKMSSYAGTTLAGWAKMNPDSVGKNVFTDPTHPSYASTQSGYVPGPGWSPGLRSNNGILTSANGGLSVTPGGGAIAHNTTAGQPAPGSVMATLTSPYGNGFATAGPARPATPAAAPANLTPPASAAPAMPAPAPTPLMPAQAPLAAAKPAMPAPAPMQRVAPPASNFDLNTIGREPGSTNAAAPGGMSWNTPAPRVAPASPLVPAPPPTASPVADMTRAVGAANAAPYKVAGNVLDAASSGLANYITKPIANY